VLIGFSQGGTVALEAVKAPGLASAVVAFCSRFAQTPARGSRIASRIHLVHGEFDSVVSRVYAERAARVLTGLHVPCTLDIVEYLGHELSHRAITLGSRACCKASRAAPGRCIERGHRPARHGSRDPEWSQPFEKIAVSVGKLPAVAVALAYLEHGPSLEEAVTALAAKALSIRVVPLLPRHRRARQGRLPKLVAQAKRAEIQLVLDKPIGEQPEVVEAIAGAISSVR
jgi:hypothetical protein